MKQSEAAFIQRHIGPNASATKEMLQTIGVGSIEALIDKTVPTAIRLQKDMQVGEGVSEYELLQSLKEIGEKKRNKQDTSELMQEVSGLGDKISILDHELIDLEKANNWLRTHLPSFIRVKDIESILSRLKAR